MAWLKITKSCPIFPGFFDEFESFFSEMEGQTFHQNNQTRYFKSIFEKYNKSNNSFEKARLLAGCFDQKVRTNLTADTYCVEKAWLFGLFSEEKGDYSDVWMTKITTERNDIDMDVCFFQKNITYKSHFCPYRSDFFY